MWEGSRRVWPRLIVAFVLMPMFGLRGIVALSPTNRRGEIRPSPEVSTRPQKRPPNSLKYQRLRRSPPPPTAQRSTFNPGHSVYFSVSSRMRRPPTARDSAVLSASSAFAVCDGLLRMAHCLIVELPESELRDIQYIIDVLASRTNQMLDLAEHDLSLNFDRLAIIPGKCSIHPCSSSDISQISIPSLELKTLARSWSKTLPLRILVDRTPLPRPPTIGISPVEHLLLLRPQLGRRFISQPRLRSQLQPLAQSRVMVVPLSRFPLGITAGFQTTLIIPLFVHPGLSYTCR